MPEPEVTTRRFFLDGFGTFELPASLVQELTGKSRIEFSLHPQLAHLPVPCVAALWETFGSYPASPSPEQTSAGDAHPRSTPPETLPSPVAAPEGSLNFDAEERDLWRKCAGWNAGLHEPSEAATIADKVVLEYRKRYGAN